jgi:hypothetical protein
MGRVMQLEGEVSEMMILLYVSWPGWDIELLVIFVLSQSTPLGFLKRLSNTNEWCNK